MIVAASSSEVVAFGLVVLVVALVVRWFGGGLLRGLRDQPLDHEARACPRCGRPIPVGVLDCADSGFDFRTIGLERRD